MASEVLPGMTFDLLEMLLLHMSSSYAPMISPVMSTILRSQVGGSVADILIY